MITMNTSNTAKLRRKHQRRIYRRSHLKRKFCSLPKTENHSFPLPELLGQGDFKFQGLLYSEGDKSLFATDNKLEVVLSQCYNKKIFYVSGTKTRTYRLRKHNTAELKNEKEDSGIKIQVNKSHFKNHYDNQYEQTSLIIMPIREEEVRKSVGPTEVPSSTLNNNEDVYSLSSSEEDDSDVHSDTSGEYGERYLDSGLRPHKENEYRLYLKPIKYKSQAKEEIDEDGVQPLLKKIPSGLYQLEKESVSTKSIPETQISSETSVFSKDIAAPSDEDITKPTEVEREDVIDTTPLLVLKNYENIKYTILLGDSDLKLIDKTYKEDFCVHNLDVPDTEMSRSSIDSAAVKGKDDFCIHTLNPAKAEEFRLSLESETSVKPYLLKSEELRKIKVKNDFCIHSFHQLNRDESGLSFDNETSRKHSLLKSEELRILKKKDDFCIHAFDLPNDMSRLSVDSEENFKEVMREKTSVRAKVNSDFDPSTPSTSKIASLNQRTAKTVTSKGSLQNEHLGSSTMVDLKEKRKLKSKLKF